VLLLLLGIHEGFGIFDSNPIFQSNIPIDTIEVLREQVDDAVITIRNNSEMLEKVEQ
jgi:hypothetical protein